MSKRAYNTKQVDLTQAFLAAAAGSEVDALAYMFMAAFGVSLESCFRTVNRIITTKATKVAVLCITAAVQVRKNVTFVGREFGDLKINFPELIIDGDRDQADHFNYGALHVCGHILANLTTSAIGTTVLKKAGDCTMGTGFTETEAGRVNREIYSGWAEDDKRAYGVWLSATKATGGVWVDGVFAGMASMRANFAAKLNPPAAAATASSTKAPGT